MIDEFEFYRRVHTVYHRVPFYVNFTYRYRYKVEETAKAFGNFSCQVNPQNQEVNYTINMKSVPISRPYSKRGSFIFRHEYAEIRTQPLHIENLPIYQATYPLPIDYDWKSFIDSGAVKIINRQSLQPLFDQYRFRDADGEEINARLRITKVLLDW
ncbi:hypothetical protein ACFO9Q_06255 [Paenibacillus sp. GCM10023252]|uniref:hypothetical protein n=1 Tax=Paenibacillus sp. GCM10023252 TaxID=3252649 RepID=UPI00361E0D3F